MKNSAACEAIVAEQGRFKGALQLVNGPNIKWSVMTYAYQSVLLYIFNEM